MSKQLIINQYSILHREVLVLNIEHYEIKKLMITAELGFNLMFSIQHYE